MEIEQIAIGADPERWAEAGFAVDGDATRVGSVGLRFAAGEGILGWRLAGIEDEVDGLPVSAATGVDPPNTAHPNGASQIDHVVVVTPDLARTTVALRDVGVERRRVREVETDCGRLRQGFFRLGEVILEAVEHSNIDPGPARFWGITFTVEDLDAAAELLGKRLGSIRDAVQPGRRIATIRREAGLGLRVAVISAREAR